MTEKNIGIKVIVDQEGMAHTSFYFKEATIGQLQTINAELDILKKDIINRIDESPKDYEVKDFGEGN